MLLSGFATGHAAISDTGTPVIAGQQQANHPCMSGEMHDENTQHTLKSSCCNSETDCNTDLNCTSCVMTSSSATAMVSNFDTMLFIHMSSRYHLSSYLLLSSALNNLYRPPRS